MLHEAGDQTVKQAAVMLKYLNCCCVTSGIV
jgi:hypothetical protein